MGSQCGGRVPPLVARSVETPLGRAKSPSTINPTGEPVTCASVTLPQYWFTINHQPSNYK
ncbi:MAG: hypothetical protein ACHBN1_26530 [Heteroscytonema crispum UTEX LB 1556]